MNIKTRLTRLRHLLANPRQRLVNRCTGNTRRERRQVLDVLAARDRAHGAAGGGVELAAAEGHGVEGVVEDEVELVVGELGLHEGVVAVVGPGGIGDVEDQGGFL